MYQFSVTSNYTFTKSPLCQEQNHPSVSKPPKLLAPQFMSASLGIQKALPSCEKLSCRGSPYVVPPTLRTLTVGFRVSKSITTTRKKYYHHSHLPDSGWGRLLGILFQRKKHQKTLQEAWGSMGEARGKRGGSVGEAGGSKGIFRGSALFDPRKRSVLGGSNQPQYPF